VKQASVRKFLRGLRNLMFWCRLQLIFNTISCGLQSRAANNEVNMVNYSTRITSKIQMKFSQFAV